MIEFRTFGTIDLRAASDGRRLEALLAQPKRIALFTYLAVASPRGFHRRDTLLGILWPEADGGRARATLNQTVYLVRRVVGDDVIIARGDDELGVNQAAIRCDALAFMDAIETGRLAEALDLYAGEFLNGFHLSASPEFEWWADEMRAHLKRAAARAARQLAEREVGAGDPAGAAHWLRRAGAIEPYDESVVRQLVGALAALGDRAGALREFDAFATRLSRDLELAPSEEIASFVNGLRTNGINPARVDGPTQGSVEPHRQAAAAEAVSPTGAALPPPDALSLPEPNAVAAASARSRRRPELAWIGAVVVALMVVMAVFTAPGAGLRRALGSADGVGFLPNRVIVLPFENRTGDSAVTTLGRLAADWLTQSLQRSGLVEVIDPNTAFRVLTEVDSGPGTSDVSHLRRAAAATGAGTVISGSILRLNDSLVFHARISDARDGKVLRTLDPMMSAMAVGAPVLETLRSRVLGALGTVMDDRLASIVAPSSPPPAFAAYQEFVLGMDRFEQRNMKGALAHFERAAQLDTTFIMSRFWVVYALNNSNQLVRRDSLIRALLPLRDRLPPVEAVALDMFDADMRADRAAALVFARRAAKLAPQSSWPFMAASIAFDLGRPREALAELAGLDPTRGWVKGFLGYWRVRLAALHQLGDYEGELVIVRLARQVFPTELAAWRQQLGLSELRALAGLGRIAELEAIIESKELTRSASQFRGMEAFAHWAVGLELRAHGFPSQAHSHFGRCLELSANSSANCLYEVGRYTEALGAFNPRAWSAFYATFTPGAAAARLGRRAEAEGALAQIAETSPVATLGEAYKYQVYFQQARIAALLGDRQRAIELLRREPSPGKLWELLHTSSDLDVLRDEPFIAGLLKPAGVSRPARDP